MTSERKVKPKSISWDSGQWVYYLYGFCSILRIDFAGIVWHFLLFNVVLLFSLSILSFLSMPSALEALCGSPQIFCFSLMNGFMWTNQENVYFSIFFNLFLLISLWQRSSPSNTFSISSSDLFLFSPSLSFMWEEKSFVFSTSSTLTQRGAKSS